MKSPLLFAKSSSVAEFASARSQPASASPSLEPQPSRSHPMQAKPRFRGLSQELGAERSSAGSVIQTKLTVGQPDDQYEQEADQVAKQVMRQIYAPVGLSAKRSVQSPQSQEEKNSMLRQPDISSEIHHSEVSSVQRQTAVDGITVAPNVEASIQQARGRGRSLPRSLQDKFESAMGADFSRVRVHTDGSSHQLNTMLQARAFTTGQDVFFRQGAYDPGSRQGQELIAHELTHVVQQNQTGQNSLKRQNEKETSLISKHSLSQLNQPGGRIQREIDTVLKSIKEKKEEDRKELEKAKEISIGESIEERHKEIESQKPRTFKDLDDTAQKSTYKHLKKIDDDTYQNEYKEKHSRTTGTLSQYVDNIQAYRKNIEMLQTEVASLKKPTNVWKLTVGKRQNIAEEIVAKEAEIVELKKKIASKEQFLRAQKAPIKDWERPELDEAKLEERKVRYLTPPERENFALHIVGGTLKQKPEGKEQMYDTKRSYTVQKGKGWGIYVMDPNGQFYAGPHVIGQFHHSSFLSGGATAGAGELKVDSGKLIEINNKTGHYKAGLYQIVQTLAQLEKDGVALNTVKLTTATIKPAYDGIASKYFEDHKGILENKENCEDKASANEENNKLKALGLYSMNGKWHTSNANVSDEELKTYKEIVENGGSEKLLEEGFVLEQGEWKNSEGKSQNEQQLLNALTGKVEEVYEDEDERCQNIAYKMLDERGMEGIIEFLKDEIQGLEWVEDEGWRAFKDPKWQDPPPEWADIGRAIEKVQNAQAK